MLVILVMLLWALPLCAASGGTSMSPPEVSDVAAVHLRRATTVEKGLTLLLHPVLHMN